MNPNGSVSITPGSGETLAVHDVGGKGFQGVVPCDPAGDMMSGKETWIVASGNSANVAAARTTHLDLFNASGSGKVLKVWGIFIIPTLAAVTGVGMTWEAIRTTAVGTGGTGLTPRPFDTANTALPSGVTARSKPTGGATTNYVHQYINSSSEETLPYGSLASILNHLGIAGILEIQPLVLRQGEGLKIDQTTNSAVGSTNIQVVFTVEAA